MVFLVLLVSMVGCAALGLHGYWFAWPVFLGLAIALLGEVASGFGVTGDEGDGE